MWPAVDRCATDVKHKEGGQQAHDEQLQQRSGRREGRTQHDRAHERPHRQPPRAARASTTAALPARANIFISYLLYLSIPKTCGAFLEGGIRSAAPSAMLWFVLAASLGAPAEQLMPQGDGANAADVAAASGVAAGVDAAHPSGVGN